VLLTAGPTFEAIDPVRGITNSSSGKMGFALAQAAAEAGADVTVVAGPSDVATPHGVSRIDTTSAAQMPRPCWRSSIAPTFSSLSRGGRLHARGSARAKAQEVRDALT
jgi:phosphopantothenoylcysteine decarboxylase/phosphopantothenate--cysteine ligase